MRIAVLMPYVEAYNAEAAPERFIAIAQAMGAEVGQSATQAINYVLTELRRFNRELNIPSTN